jgi:hypothetical protein
MKPGRWARCCATSGPVEHKIRGAANAAPFFSADQERSLAVRLLTPLHDVNGRPCNPHNSVSIIIPANTRARYRLESLNMSQALRSVGFR